MLEARCEAAAAVLDGTLYVCGGDGRVGGCRINQFARWPSTRLPSSGNDRVGGCLRSVERLNEAGAWEAAPPG